jgi:SAM-dependent methyltransferase
MLGPPLSADDAEVFEAFVVPRYLSFFGGLLVEMVLPCDQAQIAHIGCRTGFPDPVIADKVPGAEIMGVDASAAALELAHAKTDIHPEMNVTYQVCEQIPTPLPSSSFTHAFTLHPFVDPAGRAALFAELRRVLLPGGQALVTMPLRGSFPEIADMVREFALRQDLTELSLAIDRASAARPTIETISEEFEAAGLDEIDVDVQLIGVSFTNGREFLEDPISRLIVFPELRSLMPMSPEIAGPCFKYVSEAIAKYWSEGTFELTVNVGCASGRRFE